LDTGLRRNAWLEGHRATRVGLQAAGIALLAFGYRDLLTLGTRYGFAKGVEYWLFRPSDSAPLAVIALSGWLAYRRWPRVRGLPFHSGPGWAIALCLLLGPASYLWAVYTSASDLQIFALAFECIALALLRWGPAGLRAFWLPIAFLVLAVPMPAPLLLAVLFKLQIWTAQYAGWLLYMLGIPALVSGDQILRTTQTFQVIEGCSGMRSIETLTMLCILLVDLFRRHGLHAAILVLVAPPLAFLLNGFRVLTLILNPHSEVLAVHNFQGIAILLVGLTVLYLLDGLLERRLARPAAVITATPRTQTSSPLLALAALVAIGVFSAAASLWMGVWEEPDATRSSLHQLVGEGLAEWPSTAVEEDFMFRGSARFGQVVSRRFQLPDGSVSLFLADADLGQRGGSPLSPFTLYPGSGWALSDEIPPPAVASARRVDAGVLSKGSHRILVHHWYEGDLGLGVETLRSLMALDRSPFRRARPLLVVRMTTPLDLGRADLAAAQARLQRFATALEPVLEAARQPLP